MTKNLVINVIAEIKKTQTQLSGVYKYLSGFSGAR